MIPIFVLWFITLVVMLLVFGICWDNFDIPINPISAFLTFCPILNTLYFVFLLYKATRTTFTKESLIQWVKETFYL